MFPLKKPSVELKKLIETIKGVVKLIGRTEKSHLYLRSCWLTDMFWPYMISVNKAYMLKRTMCASPWES